MPLEICRDLVSPSFPLAHVQSGEKEKSDDSGSAALLSGIDSGRPVVRGRRN